MTPTHDDGQLDAQIKDLLGRAVAEAPKPPELDTPMLTKSTTPHSRKRNSWIIGGGIGLSAAAALAAFTLLPGIGNETTIQTPATDRIVDEETRDDTEDNTVATTVAAEVAAPATETPDDVVNSNPIVVVPDTTTSAQPDPDEPVRPTLPPLADESGPQVVLAGDTGVSIDGDVVLSDPVVRALLGPDGRLWYSEETEAGDRIVAVDPTSGSVEVVDVPIDEGHSMRLGDIATVQGELTLLYSTHFNRCGGFGDPNCNRTLRTFQPSANAASTVTTESAWESGWGVIHLADNGLIVTTVNNGPTHQAEFFNLSTGVTPTTEALGLEASYVDCLECPNAFSIDQTGEHVAWTERNYASDDVTIVITKLATGERAELTTSIPSFNPFLADLELAGIVVVNFDIATGLATLSQEATDASVLQPILIDLATDTTTELTAGTRATMS